ncbi:EAL domain-containing protein [Halofilum ochraceum]|uniref:EAL domain-containing protein n=1 Tax=Halofilum ochraceum TaxID=1611323 RepID=UPI000835EA4F|nr:EAL domain-containing protein [Halofilum ochraceum]
MKLARLSNVSIAGCVTGLAALLLIGLIAYDDMRARQAELVELIELQKRLDDLSAASDRQLLLGADQQSDGAFRTRAASLRRELRAMGDEYPAAQAAAQEIDRMIEALADANALATEPVTEPAESNAPGALDISPRARSLMDRVASHGVALDTALYQLLRDRQQGIATDAMWIAGSFAAAALSFGILSLAAFGLIHRRMGGPIQELASTIDRIRAGESGLRAAGRGDNELSRLADAFNRLLDERDAADDRIAAQQRALEDRERMLIDSQRIAQIGSWRLMVHEDRLEWSEETFRILGLDPALGEPTPEAFLELVHPDDRAHLLDVRTRLRDENLRHDFEFRIVRPDGSTRRVHELAETETDASGNTVALTGTIQDITEWHKVEQRLRQYHHLIESGSDLFCVIDSSHHYVLANDGYAALYGLTRESIEGLHLLDILSREFYDREVVPRLDRCLAGESLSFEGDRTYAHLGTRHFLIRYFPITASEGKGQNIGAVMTDLTDVRHAEETLREQAQLLDMAGRVARFGGWWVDLDSARIHWSDMVAEIHGMPAGYAPTVDEGLAFYAPEYREAMRARFTACAENGIAYDEEMQILDAHGQRVWVRVVAEPVHDLSGRIYCVQGAFQDISANKEADEELERINARLANVLESISDAFFTLTPEWRFDYVNSAAGDLLGRGHAELVGKHVWTEFPAAVGTPIEREYRRAMRERVTVALEEYYEPLEIWFDIRAYPTEEGLAVYFRDVTERRRMEEQLRNREEELRVSRDELAATLETRQMLINALPAHIALLDADGTIRDVNRQWRHFGMENANPDPETGVGQNYLRICDGATGDCADEAAEARTGLADVLNGERETFVLEYPCHAPDRARWFRMMANRLGGELVSGAVVMHVDITERKLAEQELNRLAYQDALTRLPSRNGFVQSLADRLWQLGWQPSAMIVMFDIQRHRDINDSHGYAVGDQLLRTVAERVNEMLGEDALAGRVGGDEFVVYLPEHPDLSAAELRAQIDALFDQPFELDGLQLDVTARFGYTLLGDEPRAHEELLREAELALFESTGSDNNNYWTAYTSAIDHEVRQRVEITQELRQALAGDEFQLHFQPKVRLDTGELIASEALLRWYHPEHGLRSPATFVTIAEQSQLIGPIGDWALNEACRHLREWQDAKLDIVRVAVNVSLVQFMVGDFPETVRSALQRHDVPPQALTLEITESVFERESENLNQQLRTLHDMGVRLSLDDFGTGYSSLLYLQRYPFDEIKIDKGFVRRMLEDPYSRQIVTTVLGVAGALNAEVVAEGVESAAERDALLGMGCRIGQGFYYSMPLESEDFRWLLEQRSHLPISHAGGAG